MPLARAQEIVLDKTVRRLGERGIVIPTYAQMRDPSLVPAGIRERLGKVGLWDLDPANLFRITWKNEPVERGGGFGGVNVLELPPELTGVRARIIVLLGTYFPTGAHKVGATFGPLVERLVSGTFDPTRQKALWPSTGNYCRGGAYDSALLGCSSVAILPEEMSKERFAWLREIGAEVVTTPGGEANVKEIFDRTKELLAQGGDGVVALNQFCEFGNPRWHYAITGPAMEEVFRSRATSGQNLAAVFLTQGSAGTLGACEYLRDVFPRLKVCAGEALQCPTLLENGHGAHRIEGIGDKHVPWILNARTIDLVAGLDDEAVVRLMRLFNEPAGRQYLAEQGVDPALVGKLGLLGISGIGNVLGCVKVAKHFELTERDLVLTVATDSMALYGSRIEEERARRGEYTPTSAAVDHERRLLGAGLDFVEELTHAARRRIHNLKYFTWVEQQGKSTEELDAQWHDPGYWKREWSQVADWDERIRDLNERVSARRG